MCYCERVYELVCASPSQRVVTHVRCRSIIEHNHYRLNGVTLSVKLCCMVFAADLVRNYI